MLEPQEDDIAVIEQSKQYLKRMVSNIVEKSKHSDTLYEMNEATITEATKQIDCFSFYPCLFQSLILQEHFVKDKSDKIVQQEQATGGFRVLGNLRKLLYGRTLAGSLHS